MVLPSVIIWFLDWLIMECYLIIDCGAIVIAWRYNCLKVVGFVVRRYGSGCEGKGRFRLDSA